MFSEVAVNMELANTKPFSISPVSSGNTGLGSCEPVVATFLSTYQHNLVCMIVFEDTLFSIYYWFTNIEFVANSTITHAWMKFIYHMYFLHKANHGILALKNTRQPFITVPGGLLNSKITNKKHKNVKTGLHVRAEISFALLVLS